LGTREPHGFGKSKAGGLVQQENLDNQAEGEGDLEVKRIGGLPEREGAGPLSNWKKRWSASKTVGENREKLFSPLPKSALMGSEGPTKEPYGEGGDRRVGKGGVGRGIWCATGGRRHGWQGGCDKVRF